jgi:hypothetical protein
MIYNGILDLDRARHLGEFRDETCQHRRPPVKLFYAQSPDESKHVAIGFKGGLFVLRIRSGHHRLQLGGGLGGQFRDLCRSIRDGVWHGVSVVDYFRSIPSFSAGVLVSSPVLFKTKREIQ